MKKVTISDLTELPIGLDGNKDFEAKEICTKDENAFGASQKKYEKAHWGKHFACNFAMALNSIAGLKSGFDSASLTALGQLFYCDAVVALFKSRIENVGSELVVPFSCPKCGSKNEMLFDLNDMTISVPESEEELRITIDLKKPFSARKGKEETEIYSLTFEPLRCKFMFESKEYPEEYRLKNKMIWHCIVGHNGQEGNPFPSPDFMELRKIDINAAEKALNDLEYGIHTSINLHCENCGHMQMQSVPLTYDSFFLTSISGKS